MSGQGSAVERSLRIFVCAWSRPEMRHAYG